MGSSRIVRVALCLLTVFHIEATGQESCESLRSYFGERRLDSEIVRKEKLQALNDLVAADNLCAKNLLGRMLFEGTYIEADRQRATAIFYDLTNRRYPQATFNYAFVLSKDSSIDKSVVVSLLLGVYANYLTDRENHPLAVKARDYAREFISENQLDQVGRDFEAGVTAAISRARDDWLTASRQIREREEFVVALFSIGLAASAASKIASAHAVKAPLLAPAPPPLPNFIYLYGNGPSLYAFPVR